jgi:hypothetical protein
MELSSELIDIETKEKRESNVLETYFATGLAAYACVLLIAAFADVAETVLLILGALLSAAVLWLNTAQIVEAALTGTFRATRVSSLVAASAGLPWTFTAYLLFYRGLWHFTALLDGFSGWVAAESIAFTLLGYLTAVALYRLSEIGLWMNRKLPHCAQ